jgi:shikimate kinase
MNIMLIGYRGTGKTSVGKRLAERLQMPFYDTDDLVEASTGRSIREIVTEDGWACFREQEREIIRKLGIWQKGVVATGGGAVMDEENVKILKKHGILIWLDADVKTIVERIQNDSRSNEQRPFFSGCDLFKETADMLEKRIPVYSRLADFSVNTAGKGIDEIVEMIDKSLPSVYPLQRSEA